MTREKINRKRTKRNSLSAHNHEDMISREKQKARNLRQSTWWRKKISTGKCHYCGDTFLPSELTMDHIIPLGRGGTSEKMNIAASCKECNNKKKYLHPTEWEEYMESLKNKKVL